MLVQSSWCHADGRSQTGHLQHFEFTALGSGGVASLFGGAAWVLPAGGALAEEGVPEELELPDAVGVPGRAEGGAPEVLELPDAAGVPGRAVGGGGVVLELPDAVVLPDRAEEGLGGVRVGGGLSLPGVAAPSG